MSQLAQSDPASTTGRRRAPHAGGFHEGELAVQRQAGVGAEAARLSRMLEPAYLSGGAADFLSSQRFAVLTGRDRGGRLWISPLTGPPGFLDAADVDRLRIHSSQVVGDPLHDLPAGQDVGLLVIDLARRLCFRINGWLSDADSRGLTVDADQAFGNCPQYIQQRDLAATDTSVGIPAADNQADPAAPRTRLTQADVDQIRAADTFFLGTTHPSRGADASHRGGPPGFVRLEDERHLWWPDYPGNNMFNSFGNLAVDPAAALLFADFATGRTLHLSGTARAERTDPGAPGDDGHTGRRVQFTVDEAILGPLAALRAEHTNAYPRNPVLTD